jgi:uncharacterized protein YkwD
MRITVTKVGLVLFGVGGALFWSHFLFGVAVPTPDVPDAPEPGVGGEVVDAVNGTEPAAIERGIHEGVNDARANASVGALSRSTALDQFAAEYAAQLADRGSLTHSDFAETASCRLAAENLALRSGTALDPGSGFVEQWLNSPGHRRNLMDRRFAETGVGVAQGPSGDWYAVQVFCS